MDEQQQELFTVKEAVAEWGISIQAVYKRLNKLKRDGLTVEKDGKHCFTRESIEAYREEGGPVFKPVEQKHSTLKQEVESLTTSLNTLKAELLEERGRASTLQATIDAQQAHISSLQAALDKAQTALNQEQTLHMATMQQRLPAGQGGLFAWIRGKVKGNT